MPFDTRIGVLCKFYYNSGTYGTPVWEEVDLIGDLQENAAWEEGDSSARRARVRTMEPTLLALDLAGRIRTDYLDPNYNAIRDAFLETSTLDMLVLTGDVTQEGSLGFRFDGKIFGFSTDQSLGNVIFNDLTMKPCASDNDPMSATVSGSALVFGPLGEATL